MNFAHPYLLLLLLALPLLAWLKGRRGQPPAFVYSSLQLVRGLGHVHRSRAGTLLAALRWLAVASLLVALAQPRFSTTQTEVKATGVDIVVAMDLSGSMESEDFERRGERINRLQMAKEVLESFILKRPGDRIGLVAFSGKAYIASPLTLDHEFLLENVDHLRLHMVEEGTAIGAGLATAVNRLRDLKAKSKIVILMTDGQNNVNEVAPMTAAEAAKALKVKVYTIGVGTRGEAPMPVMMFGQKVYQNIHVDIDEPTLQKIADLTGGKYYRADNARTFHQIYDEIDRMEKTEAVVKKYSQHRELFVWFVCLGLALLLVEVLLAQTVWRRLP